MSGKYKIAVVGIGYVGVSMAVLLGQHSEVVALDIDAARVALINQGRTPVMDQGLQAFLDSK